MTLIAGCLIYELFSGAKLARTEDLRNTASIPKVSSHDFTSSLILHHAITFIGFGVSSLF